MQYTIYDNNFDFLYKDRTINDTILNLKKIFKHEILKELRKIAIKLSEDFPNFIRVDLYIFHDNIYFSELTFANNKGLPRFRDKEFVRKSVINFSRIDDY